MLLDSSSGHGGEEHPFVWSTETVAEMEFHRMESPSLEAEEDLEVNARSYKGST